MGYILKLPTAGDTSLPTLGDIGYVSKQNLKGLYLIDGANGLTDASGNGNHLSLLNGSLTPPYSNGVLQFRSANAQRLSTGIAVTGPNETIITVYRKLSAPSNGQNIFGHGIGLSTDDTSPMSLIDSFDATAGKVVKIFGLQAKRPEITFGDNGVGVWRCVIGVRDQNGVSISTNGSALVTQLYASAQPGATTSYVDIGETAAGFRHLDADLGLFAVYERALTSAEIASTYKAIKRIMTAKGIAI
ncbi:MAG: hypothetical protein KDJ17_12040 [Hyphomicrobiaceae bacterium]|nr:hypothetical protein [Hyphomicrobiaceae bacterium]